jgi:hypothetical protein
MRQSYGISYWTRKELDTIIFLTHQELDSTSYWICHELDGISYWTLTGTTGTGNRCLKHQELDNCGQIRNCTVPATGHIRSWIALATRYNRGWRTNYWKRVELDSVCHWMHQERMNQLLDTRSWTALASVYTKNRIEPTTGRMRNWPAPATSGQHLLLKIRTRQWQPLDTPVGQHQPLDTSETVQHQLLDTPGSTGHIRNCTVPTSGNNRNWKASATRYTRN